MGSIQLRLLTGRQMPEYHAYVIGEDGHIKQRIDLCLR
jgi:hypothetical protein